MKKILLLLFVFAINISAQNSFKIDFDYSRFNYDEENSYVEIYYSFYRPALKAVQSDSDLVVKGLLNVKINRLVDNESLIDQSYQFNNKVSDSEVTDNQKKLTGSLGFIVPKGDYKCFLTGRDGNDTTRIDTITFELNLTKLPDAHFSVSDVQLAASIRETDNKNSVFYKNTYEVIPNPSGVFGEQLPIIYYYLELYNTDLNVMSEFLQVDNVLLNAKNQVVQKKSKLLPRKTNSIVEAGTVNITKVPSGTYVLVVAVRDSIKNISVYSSKKLFIYNPSVADTSSTIPIEQDAATSEFAAMSEEELDEVFGYSKYIATNKEQDQWKTLTAAEGKKTFLYNFWRSRDNELNSSGNTFKRNYFNRVHASNQRFTTIQKKGWKTDRGRVFISVGEPSEIERYPNQTDARPYEIWYYNEIEGGVIFIFADLTGFSDYQLIHSSMRGELRDDNWMRRILIQ